MYSKDKSMRFNVRLSADQYEKIEKLSNSAGINVSSAFRMILDSYFKDGQIAFLVLDGVKNEDK